MGFEDWDLEATAHPEERLNQSHHPKPQTPSREPNGHTQPQPREKWTSEPLECGDENSRGTGIRRTGEMSSLLMQRDSTEEGRISSGRRSHSPLFSSSRPSPIHQPPVTGRRLPTGARGAETVQTTDPQALSLREEKSSAAEEGRAEAVTWS